MLPAVLVLRFLLELILLIALAAWGARLGDGAALHWLGGGAAALAGAAIWGFFIAPRRQFEIGRIPRFALEIALFCAGGLALGGLGQPLAGAALILLAVAQRIGLIWLWRRKMVQRWER